MRRLVRTLAAVLLALAELRPGRLRRRAGVLEAVPAAALPGKRRVGHADDGGHPRRPAERRDRGRSRRGRGRPDRRGLDPRRPDHASAPAFAMRRAFCFDRPYGSAPVSTHMLWHRPQDLAFEQADRRQPPPAPPRPDLAGHAPARRGSRCGSAPPPTTRAVEVLELHGRVDAPHRSRGGPRSATSWSRICGALDGWKGWRARRSDPRSRQAATVAATEYRTRRAARADDPASAGAARGRYRSGSSTSTGLAGPRRSRSSARRATPAAGRGSGGRTRCPTGPVVCT